MSTPKRIEGGTHTGRVYCTQYSCKNNHGIQKGIITDSNFPSGCCKLKNPKFTEFNNNTWGCSDERYIHENKRNEIKVPKECYEKFGQDLDGCSTQSSEGCGRCSIYK